MILSLKGNSQIFKLALAWKRTMMCLTYGVKKSEKKSVEKLCLFCEIETFLFGNIQHINERTMPLVEA